MINMAIVNEIVTEKRYDELTLGMMLNLDDLKFSVVIEDGHITKLIYERHKKEEV